MTLTPAIVGTTFDPVISSWDSRDCALYALGIGAGQDDPYAELAFTTTNTREHPQVVCPTFAVVPGCAAGIGAVVGLMRDSLSGMLHGEQAVEQLAPLPTAATVATTARVTAAWDKGRSTIVETTADIRDTTNDVLYARTTQSLFFRGVGGWGGERGPATRPREQPTRAPDDKFRTNSRPDQALLYRLSGDPNPLHTDPAVARRAGFDRPILHGLCTFGIVGRALLTRYADADVTRFGFLSVRMSAPTVPGAALSVLTWVDGPDVDFVVVDERDDAVLSHGLFRLAP